MNQQALFAAKRECPTIQEQTGWRRVHPMQICQEPSALLAVSSYSYDLSNKHFVSYFLDRTGIDLHHDHLDRRRIFFITAPWPEVERWILSSPELTYLGTGLPVAEMERHSMVKVWKIMRAKLQDCWEIWITSIVPEGISMNLEKAKNINTDLGISINDIENSRPENLPAIAAASIMKAYLALMLVAADDKFSFRLETISPGTMLRVTEARNQLVRALRSGSNSENIRSQTREHLAAIVGITALWVNHMEQAA
ncbi:MAG: hypothetical protein WCZ86_03865 [Desulfurivibrionaceae bacterium]|jgi:hypothetical protein